MTKLLALASIALAPTTALAHPGHGTVDTSSVRAVGVAVLVAGCVLVSAYLRRQRT